MKWEGYRKHMQFFFSLLQAFICMLLIQVAKIWKCTIKIYFCQLVVLLAHKRQLLIFQEFCELDIKPAIIKN